MFGFKVYAKENDCAVLKKTVEVEPTDHEALSKIKEMVKDKAVYVAPNDADSAFVLMQTARRGARSNWTPPMVVRAHEMRANDNHSDLKIAFELYREFETEVTADSVKKTLRQETNLDVTLEEGLREKAVAATPAKRKKGAAKKVTPELREEILARFNKGETGSAIAKDIGVSSSTVNNIIRKEYGYRRTNGGS